MCFRSVCLSTHFNLGCIFGSVQGTGFISVMHMFSVKHFQRTFVLLWPWPCDPISPWLGHDVSPWCSAIIVVSVEEYLSVRLLLHTFLFMHLWSFLHTPSACGNHVTRNRLKTYGENASAVLLHTHSWLIGNAHVFITARWVGSSIHARRNENEAVLISYSEHVGWRFFFELAAFQ